MCAVIQLPSQTLLLSVSDKACRLIGMLFPGKALSSQDSSFDQCYYQGSGNPQNNEELLDLLYKITIKNEVTSNPTSYTFVQSEIISMALLSTTILNSSSWIIDSGATDHMTKDSNCFISLEIPIPTL
ncbi:Mediator of RNA polymerase II transcription subunit 25 [Vitis vinifera]|uniref:Mediator of RNA polymerase II transcription subunit 25 n=1 Tax=Vitis vinifera TaxID=29760 RepID=A0A438FYN4_VITVI|nr:Mediator of RNA polymerase II transcription subunit 25 [Vitis vinifera]